MKQVYNTTKTGLVALAFSTALVLSAPTAVFAQTDTNNASKNTTAQDWNDMDSYWRDNFKTRPYYKEGSTYESYQPAYRYGSDLHDKNAGKKFDELDETSIRSEWEKNPNRGALSWDDAKEPARDAYDRRATGAKPVSGNTGPKAPATTGTTNY